MVAGGCGKYRKFFSAHLPGRAANCGKLRAVKYWSPEMAEGSSMTRRLPSSKPPSRCPSGGHPHSRSAQGLRRTHRHRRRVGRHRSRRILHDRGAERLRQDHAAAHPGRARNRHRPARSRSRRRIPQRPVNSMIFQGDSIFPWMTVWDNAAYGLRCAACRAATIKEVVGHYLARTGLTRFADYYPHQLSGGMRQRVSIARAFANDPEILLMDEPFSALDAQNKLLLQEELLRIWEEHKKTVVFITHSRRRGGVSRRPHHGHDGAAGQGEDLRAGAASRVRATSWSCRRRPEYGELVAASGRACAKRSQRARRAGRGDEIMSVQTIATGAAHGAENVGTHARPPVEHHLAARAAASVGALRALRLHRHAVFSGAVERDGDADRDAAHGRARHPHRGEHAAPAYGAICSAAFPRSSSASPWGSTGRSARCSIR